MNRLAGCLVMLLIVFSCQDSTEDISVNEVGFWIGSYEIHAINGDSADCAIFYLLPEIIELQKDEVFLVRNQCDQNIIVQGKYKFDEGLFTLFIDRLIQEPSDRPEFEMQIFENEDRQVRIYRCVPFTGECSVRIGVRL